MSFSDNEKMAEKGINFSNGSLEILPKTNFSLETDKNDFLKKKLALFYIKQRIKQMAGYWP